MKKLIFIFLSALIFYSCDVKKSAHKDLTTGLTTIGDGLICEEVSISSDDDLIRSNTFTFGEVVNFKFKNIEGFNEVDGKIFPVMSIIIRDDKKTVLQTDDVYSDYSEKINSSNIVLNAEITLAKPIYSGKKYNLLIRIWDKKGDGKLSAEMNFEVKSNDKISVTKNNCNYDEIYLYSEKKNKVITDNIIASGENVSLIFEGVKNFSEDSDKVYPGLSLIITDSKDDTILRSEDLFNEYAQTGIDASEFKNRLSADFWISG
jgi:hypothetical protein